MDDDLGSPQSAWWHGASGLPDMDALLGPEGMAAVGDVADEALKLFVLLRERFAATGDEAAAAAGSAAAASPWQAMLGQVAQGALRTVQEMAAGTANGFPGSSVGPQETAATPLIAPGEAAACSYCPVCQAIALFRSVPMSTWQRLATSVVEVADAARDFAVARGQDGAGAVTEPMQPQPGSTETVDDFLRSVESDDPGRGARGAAADGTK